MAQSRYSRVTGTNENMANEWQTGSEKYKSLENVIYVGAQRMNLEKDKPVTVELRLSRVGAGKAVGN